MLSCGKHISPGKARWRFQRKTGSETEDNGRIVSTELNALRGEVRLFLPRKTRKNWKVGFQPRSKSFILSFTSSGSLTSLSAAAWHPHVPFPHHLLTGHPSSPGWDGAALWFRGGRLSPWGFPPQFGGIIQPGSPIRQHYISWCILWRLKDQHHFSVL